MYFEDDRFNPNNNDGEYFDYAKNALDDIKKNDRGYRKIKRVMNKEWKDKYYKSVNVEMYLSGDTGSNIRNAITGRYMPHEVGYKEEDLYFKTSIEYTIAGPNQGSLFYSSPEEYENHQFVSLASNIKQAWYQKNFLARKSIE